MRLHRLEMTAFGPFADTAEVDFDALGADGLFLLHGRTGAGKTSILDAIAFALYGTVPGSRREAKRLHSDHAAADVTPRVVLEVTLGGRRLRLERTPEFQRPKKRGTGVRTEQAHATLTWLDGRGPGLSRILDVAEEINRLLGMSADQFFQVVLLPQGDFDRFLSADNEDRQRLLERLFDTERFGNAEQWLLDRRRTGAAELENRRQGVERTIAQLCAVSGAEPQTELPDAAEWSQGLLTEAKAEMVRTEAELVVCKEFAAKSDVALQEGRRWDELFRRRAGARARRAEYDSGAAARAVANHELTQARRAQPVQFALADAGAAASTVIAAEAELRTVTTRLAGIIGGAEAAREGSDLDAEIRRWSADIGALDTVSADAADADRLTADAAALKTEQQEIDQRSDRLGRTIAELPAAIAEATERLRKAVEAEAGCPGLAAERERADRAAAAAVELVATRATVTTAEAEAAAAREAHLDARERVQMLRERRLLGMAAELATGLETGKPCTVCGSTTHPQPAVSTGETVTEAVEAAAVEAENVAAVRRDTAAARVAELIRRVDVLVADGGDGDIAKLRAAAETAAVRLTEAEELAGRLPALTEQLEQLRATEQQHRATLQESRDRAATVAERIAAIENRLAQLQSRIGVVVGEDGTVDRRRSRLTQLIEAATVLREARAAVQTATIAAAERAERVVELTVEAGFDDPQQATAALRTPQRIEAIEAELASAEESRAHADAVLAEPDVQSLPETAGYALEELEQAAAQADIAVQAAVAEHADATRRVAALEELGAQLWAAMDRLAPLQRRQNDLAALTDVVVGRGSNNRRMSLQSYVLAARLEEVAIAGSMRLSRMSGGRYEFVHSDAAGPRGRRGGLGLDIRDDYTGRIRPSKTLSGGEKFMASLALALGLADTVSAESGGLALDTMFIDEGFGSLDSQALDEVMGVLDELRAGGRVVGVVSHVDEMRRRIPSRLHVIREPTGSRLETTTTSGEAVA